MALAAVGLTVSAIRGIDRTDYQTDKSVATLKVEVAAVEQRLRRAEDRMEKADVRWEQIKDDLAKIKGRLGILEAGSLQTLTGSRPEQVGRRVMRGSRRFLR